MNPTATPDNWLRIQQLHLKIKMKETADFWRKMQFVSQSLSVCSRCLATAAAAMGGKEGDSVYRPLLAFLSRKSITTNLVAETIPQTHI